MGTLTNFLYIHRKTCAKSRFSQSCEAEARSCIRKETLGQVVSNNFCKIFNSSFFLWAHLVAASMQPYRLYMNSKAFVIDLYYWFQNSSYVEKFPFRVTLSSYLSEQLFYQKAIFLNSCFSDELFFITATTRDALYKSCS